MTTITATEAERLLAELAARYGSEPYDVARDITARQVATLLGLDEEAARRRLERELRAGVLEARWANVAGHRVKVYRRN